MSKFPNEQQLTAYVLGELPEAERLRVEEAVKRDASLAAELERIRKTAGYLRENLKKDAELKLSPVRRAALEAALRKRTAPGGAGRWFRSLYKPYVLGPVAAAALIFIVIWQGGVPKATSPVAEKAQEVMAPSSPVAAPAPASQSPAPEPETPGEKAYAPPARPLPGRTSAAGGATRQGPALEESAPSAPAEEDSVRHEPPATLERRRNLAPPAAPPVEVESAPVAEQKRAAPASIPVAKGILTPEAQIRAGAFAIEVRIPSKVGGAADAQRIARQVAERVTTPAKPKKNESAAGASVAREKDKAEGLQVLEKQSALDIAHCEIVVTVVDPSGGEPGKVMRREAACNVEALAAAFAELARQVKPER